ncbi:hypothetical protein PQR29_19940 [Paraburkholderia strydomiana]|uniref:hypothetical protein n=1 Tax=Paraburkholderia strydomiana TaxID=1245417 RepID=UPI0038BD489C
MEHHHNGDISCHRDGLLTKPADTRFAKMKYKNIYSAIHNLGASFTSLMNYVLDGYVIDELESIHHQRLDIEVDWLSGAFAPESLESARIRASIEYYCEGLTRQFAQQNVDVASITQLRFHWPAGGRKYMAATDNRGKSYKIYVNESK